MRVYLKAFILNLTKKDAAIAGSSFIPTRLRQIEREMEAGKLTIDDVMKRLKSEEKFDKFFSDGDWKMIEKEIGKMIR